MRQKKLKCSQEDYELLKEARYEYHKTRDKIEKLEADVEDLLQKTPVKDYELSIRIRNEEIVHLNRRKQELNDLVAELETNCFGSEE